MTGDEDLDIYVVQITCKRKGWTVVGKYVFFKVVAVTFFQRVVKSKSQICSLLNI